MITLFRLFVFLMLLLIAGLQMRLWVGQGSLAHVNSLQKEVNVQMAANERKRQRNAVLQAEIKDLKQGLDAVEDIVRSELGLIKEGETFFLLPEDATP